MSGYQSRLRGRDALVALGCVLFAFLTLGAIGEGGRRRAKEIVCQSNLRQWHNVFQGYIEQNDGKFFSGCNDWGYWWPMQLSHEWQDWKRNRTWFCPTATTPVWNEAGVPKQSLYVTDAWGIVKPSMPGVWWSMAYQGKTYSLNPNGLNGSYGLNGYMLSIPENGTYEGGVPAADGFPDMLNVKNADEIPVMLDALRFDLWPQETDGPAINEFEFWVARAYYSMVKVCINRHGGAVNCLFVDGSVRKVGLKELWTLKWHKSFDTAGPWTTAGGVQPEDWPEWMREFRDY